MPRADSRGARFIKCLRGLELIDRDRYGMIAAFEEELERIDVESFDLIWIERRDLLQVVKVDKYKIIVDFDDIEHRKKMSEIRTRHGLLSKIKGMPRVFGLFIGETVLSRGFRAVIVCSNEDHSYLEKCRVQQSKMIPNGTSLANKLVNVKDDQVGDILFVGNFQYDANADALRWFHDSIHPHLTRHKNQITLHAVGNKPVSDDFSPDIIRFKGFVDDLGAEIGKYQIAVAPLRFGGGTKLKVLDILGSGIPLVTTSIGAEGLGLQDGIHALIADDAAVFAQQIMRLRGDYDLRERLSKNASALVQERYTWDAIVSDTNRWLESLV